MAVRKREEYDWLEDPFNEEKCAQELAEAKSSGVSKLGCVLLAVIVAILACVVGAAVVLGRLSGMA